ncbi:hypothetical protein [Enterococcus sp. AZ180]|uniref:hypothetical protein n=1 Tax=Enterococcus sp. AZ180 TaxID=2774961 RepID=UPI003F257E8D
MGKVLALNDMGVVTYCSAAEDQRGKGRCNHVTHQEEGESPAEFFVRVENGIKDTYEDSAIPDESAIIKEVIAEHAVSFNKNPDWDNFIKNKVANPFVIGSKADGTYEEADIQQVEEIDGFNELGDPIVSLKAKVSFRGQEYEVDLGEVPKVQDDGTIIMNGSEFRVLPVLAQHKSGVIQYRESIIVKQENSPYFSMQVNVEDGSILINKRKVDPEEVAKHLRGEESSLDEKTKMSLDNMDPIAYERFPELKDGNIQAMLDKHEPDEPNDISYRKVLSYEDQVGAVISAQMRRMGVTFRTNLAKHAANPDLDDDKFPLFYQKNMTENIKKDLIGKSNVQLADNLNPLTALSQSRKISLTGLGGYNKDKAPASLRLPHRSHQNVIDSMDISSGKNIGLTIALADSDVDSRGFIVKNPDSSKSIALSDFIPYKNHSDVNRAAMATAHMKQATPIVGGEDPRPLGDKSDAYWKQIAGAKMGSNVRVAYIPSVNTHEDSVMISESMAKKYETKQVKSYRVKEGESTSKLKVGDMVSTGDYVNGHVIAKGGIIKSVSDKSFDIETSYKMKVGDKIAGRFGNKGVVSKIMPDKDMPKIKCDDGKFKPAEILMSPAGVVGRMNIGQVLETNGGELNKLTKVKLKSGNEINATAGTQYVMRLNHIAEKKLAAHEDGKDSMRRPVGLRLGEMESLLLSETPERREVLNFLRHQGKDTDESREKLDSLMKSVGVTIK